MTPSGPCGSAASMTSVTGTGGAKFVTGEHWTGSPNKSIDQIGKSCQKMSEKRLFSAGKAFLLTVGAFLLTVELLCLQSLKALIRRSFPL